VCFEMGCQLVDASCEQSHLDFGATRVIGGASVGLDDLSLDRGCNHFFFLFFAFESKQQCGFNQ